MDGRLPYKFEAEQFEELFRAEYTRLCGFARQYVHDDDMAKDICQHVFIKLWERRNEIDRNKSVTSYLFTAVKNRCLNYIRDNKKFRSNLLDVVCGDIDFVDPNDSDHLEFAELQASIEYALERLPDKCRKVFELSRFHHKKYREIAEELGIAQKTVEAHMSKAMRILRECLKSYRLIGTLVFLMNFFFK